MALKKPSELFNDNQKKRVEVPEQLEGTLPENFDVYKSNVKNIEVLNDFVNSFGTLKENIQKIDNLQEVIQSLKEDLQNSITKEDLDTAMMSNLLILEKNIQKIELDLKGINRKDLNRIDEEIGEIENKVIYVLEEEFPKYKKALKSSEIFIKDKFYEYTTEIDQKVNQFEEFIAGSFEVIQENLQSINDNQLLDIRENVIKSSQEVENQNQLIEKTKKQIFGLEKDVQEFYQKIQETFQSYQQSQEEKILTLEESIIDFNDKESKKYKDLLHKTRIQNDEKIHSFEKNLTEKYSELSQSVSSLLLSVEDKSIIIEETSSIVESIKENLKEIQSDYSKKDDQQKNIETLREHLTKKINLLENDISFKEGKIKKVNQELTEAIEIISNQFEDLNVEDLKKKYSHLTNKISYIEEVFDKFNEKTVLNEGLLNDPPTIKNTDPLTPLDKNFVTLDQLQQHYRLFINRIQQQLATIGGGGETRLEFLDDIDRTSAKVNGRFLKYDSASDKWIGALGGGGGSQTLDDTLGLGNTSSIGMSVGVVTATLFYGDGSNLTGILTSTNGLASEVYVDNAISFATYDLLSSTGNGSNLAGIVTSITAGSGISINQSIGNVTITATGGGSGGGESYWAATSAGIHTLFNVGIGTTAKNDFKFYVEGNAKVTGILTVGNQSVTIDGVNNTIKVGSGVTIDGNTGIISASAVYIAGSQVSTFSGNYNDLTNKPDLSTISVAYATTAGIATYASTAGIATYATNAGVSTYATSSGIATYASTAGIATYATNAGVTTALQNSRTFEITGDIVASPISFDGTGNVSLAATIQPNSVALGGDTTGDYVQTITGTSNQITVTGGTGEGSTPTLSIPSQFTVPQDIEVIRDLQVNRNLNVNGNITLGGTTAFINVQELKIADPDIILGVRSDAFGNDVSNDNTANHGGIAIASTEGNPLVQLFIAGIESAPPTYKKIMWFKSGEFAGLGTDAWLMNYAVGIGSTQFPTGTRLAAGNVQFTHNDLAVVRNINASGVVTATTFVGALTGTATSTTNIPNLTGDITSNNTTTTLASVNSNVGTYGDAGAIPSITVNAKGLVTGVTTVAPNNGQLSLAVSGTGLSGSATFTANQSGSSTFTVTSNATDANTSSTIVARDASGNFSAGTITANLTGTATTATNLADAANITTGTINSARLSGTYNINVSYASTAGIATVAQGLIGTPNITVGVATATSFVKSGGTSSQFLKADGSVDTSTYLTTTGSGTNLTGIVTSIVAGTNVTISGSTGQVTINATGGGGSSGVVIQDQGSTVGTATTINFSTNLTASFSGGVATVTATGGGGGATAAPLDILEVMMFV